MIGEVIVAGINLTTLFGVFITEGGYKGLVTPPSLKEPEVIDWAEENGLDVDLAAPKFHNREFEITFGTVRSNADIDSFISYLKVGAYNTFTFPELSITAKLRLVSGSNYVGSDSGVRLFSLVFAEDEPMLNYVYQTPVGGKYSIQGYEIDGTDLSAYGVAVLEGTDAEILRVPEVKQGLGFTNSTLNGIKYDPASVKFKAKNVRLKLLMTSVNGANFTRNMNALIYDLMRPKLRQFHVTKFNKTYSCYYVSSEIGDLYISNGIWCVFQITLRFCK